MTLNPLDDILLGNHVSDVPRLHTSGRREDREAGRECKGYYRPRPDGKQGTLPIVRAVPKVKGKKKNKKKLKLGLPGQPAA